MSLSLTSIHTTRITGIPLGTTTTIQVRGVTEAITTRGTTTDTAGTTAMTHGTTTAGTEDGMEVSMTRGTIAHGIRDSTILTTPTCTHITVDGTEDGAHTSEAYITIPHMQEASAAQEEEKFIEAIDRRQ